jgi:uncharacterized protein (TIGR02611 family)
MTPVGRIRPAPAARLGSRLGRSRTRIRTLPGGALGWRIAVTVVGALVVVAGIILLPLPGPGWLVIFAGLGLLASEYEWAARLLRRARELVGRWTRWALRQPLWGRALLGVGGVGLLGGALGASWYAYDLG